MIHYNSYNAMNKKNYNSNYYNSQRFSDTRISYNGSNSDANGRDWISKKKDYTNNFNNRNETYASSQKNNYKGVANNWSQRNNKIENSVEEDFEDTSFTPCNENYNKKSSENTKNNLKDRSYMCYGRDESYPNELNSLINPLNCILCGVRFNSIMSAKLHYDSKTHDKNLTNWLYVNYVLKGLEIPPIRRICHTKIITNKDLCCEVCDLRFTSIIHGQQHYEGRRHRLNLKRREKYGPLPKYNSDQLHLEDTKGLRNSYSGRNSYDSHLTCKLCNITATSITQLDTHFHGATHQRRLKLAEIIGNIDIEAAEQMRTEAWDNVNKSNVDVNFDLYRVSNSQFYCELCQVYLNHENILKQHLFGRKHLKREADSENCNSLS